jgi:hypothetical protein
MATPIQTANPLYSASPSLDREAGFDLLSSMYGSFHELYERCGGVESVLREIDGEDSETVSE